MQYALTKDGLFSRLFIFFKEINIIGRMLKLEIESK